ncbi:Na(+)/H(+) antiporter NhaA [Arcobacter sp. 31_11_sub10_T18]|nr:Na(+)/H(+) antiporter NhaA [Arcobacter sp. 31_11_sub10_T18]
MKVVEDFIKKESSAGIILIIVTLIALTLENSPLSIHYNEFLHIPVEIKFANLHIAKPLLLWINDGLMAIFFMLIGLEVKREILEGELSSREQVVLPLIAAVGGMVVPALFYVLFNYNDEFAMKGWAIPTATDIAFALGILSLLGNRVPASLKIFLMALAIIDDLGAIVIIALFYTSNLSIASIVVAAVSLSTLILMNIFKVSKQSLYIVVGIILWVSVLKSGVHATLAGVALAFCIPMISHDENGNEFSMAKDIEHGLHYWVAFLILPLFAFVNAGINLSEISVDQMFGGVPMGIIAGLLIGKQVGVFGFCYLAIKFGYATLPSGSNMMQLYGLSVLTGIGFTMSLFVDSLAFTDASLYQYADKLAIIIASVLSGVIGYLILRRAA